MMTPSDGKVTVVPGWSPMGVSASGAHPGLSVLVRMV